MFLFVCVYFPFFFVLPSIFSQRPIQSGWMTWSVWARSPLWLTALPVTLVTQTAITTRTPESDAQVSGR